MSTIYIAYSVNISDKITIMLIDLIPNPLDKYITGVTPVLEELA